MTAVTAPNAFEQFLTLYGKNARGFVREVLGAKPQRWQEEVLEAYDKGERRITIRSGHGVGKTTLLAWMCVHHIVCRFPQKTVITAPTAAQLWDALWAEIRAWIARLPAALQECLVCKADRIELVAAPDESFVSARTSRAEQPEALQGVHAANVLLIADEASGIPPQVFEAAAGSMSGHSALTVLAGNPVRTSGFFYDTHHKLADMWAVFHVPCAASRFVTPDYIKDMGRRYGELSNAFRVRVLGEFPVTDDDTVIPFDLVEASLTRDVVPVRTAIPVWGVDCARFGMDRSTLAKRRGNVLLEPVRAWRQLDTMQLAGRIKHEWDETPVTERPTHINVDVIGLGAGVVDRLRQLGLPAVGINVSEVPSLHRDKYRNLRAELWFRAREWFARRDCRIPKQEELIEELVAPRFKFAPQSDKLMVESKDEMKKRGGLEDNRSPDLADAFILTFAGEAGLLLHGSGASRSWATPLKRVIKGIV